MCSCPYTEGAIDLMMRSTMRGSWLSFNSAFLSSSVMAFADDATSRFTTLLASMTVEKTGKPWRVFRDTSKRLV